MTGVETYVAARPFKGIDLNGASTDFKVGDVVEGVENWPTFRSLKNTRFISLSEKKTSSEKTAPMGSVKETEPVKQKTTEPKTEEKVEVKSSKDKEGEFACDHKGCKKSFSNSRSLNIHKRYHKK